MLYYTILYYTIPYHTILYCTILILMLYTIHYTLYTILYSVQPQAPPLAIQGGRRAESPGAAASFAYIS